MMPGQAGAQDSPPSPALAGSRRPRRRWPWVLLVTLVALVIAAVAVDFIAKSVAQGRIASRIQEQGFPVKPAVTIEGFPFLTQVASHDIGQVRVSAADFSEGSVRISALSAVMMGVHLNSGFTSGTVDSVTGSVFVTFPALADALAAQAGPLGSVVKAGLHLSAAGPDEVTASVDLVVTSGSATWRVSSRGGDEINASLVAHQGIPSSLLSAISDLSVTIPQLPLGVTIDGVSVTSRGVRGRFSGHDVPFGS
jgi:LmeA-like phospholipid-binding